MQMFSFTITIIIITIIIIMIIFFIALEKGHGYTTKQNKQTKQTEETNKNKLRNPTKTNRGITQQSKLTKRHPGP